MSVNQQPVPAPQSWLDTLPEFTEEAVNPRRMTVDLGIFSYN
jgi:hypothetical protein